MDPQITAKINPELASYTKIGRIEKLYPKLTETFNRIDSQKRMLFDTLFAGRGR